MAITGTLLKYGAFFVSNFGDDKPEPVIGVVIGLDAQNLHDAIPLIGGPVEIWPACAPDLAPGECTPENYAHLKARLADAADNLAREVRSNQAAALVRADLEARVIELEKACNVFEADALKMCKCVELHRSDLSKARSENYRLASELAVALSRLGGNEAELANVWQPQGGCMPDSD